MNSAPCHLNFKKAYDKVKTFVINSGYQNEVKWQANISYDDVTESDFLREGAWVILNSGMRESVIRKHFLNLSFCFFEWESAKKIMESKEFCNEAALNIFNNKRKILAIIDMSARVRSIGFKKLKKHLKKNPIEFLQTFQHIGPITSYHLAKNLGLRIAKPDRHLVRLSNFLGFTDVQKLCSIISDKSGDNISVVDIVLWRFATLNTNYLNCFLNYSK
jgi:hypothetical protein